MIVRAGHATYSCIPNAIESMFFFQLAASPPPPVMNVGERPSRTHTGFQPSDLISSLQSGTK
jgi:hypothetical protein